MKDEIIMNCDDFVEKARSKKILSDLDELEQDIPVSLISKNRPEPKKKKKKDEADKMEEETDYDSTWLATLSEFKVQPIKRVKSSRSDIFDTYYGNGKKKKKKKKKKGELTDYNKEFEKEQLLIKNLLSDQTKFVNALQQKYNLMENTKSSARGVGKFTTDLISAINQARQVSLSLIDKNIAIKKTIADLTIKEKKEFGSKNEGSEDMGLYSSRFLKEMLNEGRGVINSAGMYSNEVIDEVDPDELFDNIDSNLGGDSNTAETDKYLEYEKRNVTIYACINDATGDTHYEAYDEDGELLPDYPLPMVEGKLNINRSTNVATDKYSKKFPIKWV